MAIRCWTCGEPDCGGFCRTFECPECGAPIQVDGETWECPECGLESAEPDYEAMVR